MFRYIVLNNMSLIHYHLMGNMNMLKLKEDILTIKTKTKL